MKNTQLTILIFFSLLLIGLSQEMQKFTFNSEDSFFLKELTAIVKEKDGKIVFELIPGQVLEQEKFKNLDLKKDDEILFINGKRIKALSDLQETYELIEPGQEIKLGIKRGKEQFFASLTREDQSEMGGQIMMMNSGENVTADGKGGKIVVDGKEVDLDSLKKSGNVIIVPQKKKKDDE